MSYKISAVLFQEGDWWSAQCLEYDIATQAKTLPQLYYELGRVLVGHMVVNAELGLDPFEKLSSAPQKYWEMFEKSKLRLDREPVPFRVPRNVLHPIPIPEVRVAEFQPA